MQRREGVEVARRSALVFGSYDADLHPRVAVLREGLAERGWQVEEINAPLGASTADKVAAATSPRAAAHLAGLQLSSWRSLVGGARRRGGAGRDARPDPDVVVVGYLGHADIHLARLLFRRSTIVLDHLVGLADTVSDRRLGTGPKVRALHAVDRAALAAADVVVVDTPEQADALPERARAKAVVVPVGAGAAWFAAADHAQAPAAPGASAPPPPAGPEATAPRPAAAPDQLRRPPAGPGADHVPPLRVIFFGLYTPLQGAPTIGRALALLRDEPIEFTMVGHGQDLAETRALAGGSPNVRWIDWVEPGDLPALVAGHDACLGIFGTSPKAQRVIPTKVYQAMAAGCAVITADTPAVAALGDAVRRVPPGDPDALAAALRALAADRQALLAARDRARRSARQFSPGAAVAALDRRLAELPRQPAALPPLTLNAWARWDVVDRELSALDARDVLEIGPGEGAAACRLARGRAYTGVELSARTRAITERRLTAQGTPGRLLGSLDELAPDERFDLVCAFEVIEHIDDDRSALAEWSARVRPGGAMILSTPADPERMGPHDVIAGHYRRYSADGLASLAERAGLVDVRVIHVGYPIGYALEAVRNVVARRRLSGPDAPPLAEGDVAELTEASSSILQPPAWAGTATRLASGPGRWLQRRRPDRGPGLVLVARAPLGGAR